MSDSQETSTAAQPANPFAALGSTGAAFGGAGAGFTFSASTAAPAFGAPAKAAGEDEEGGDEDGTAPEEECQAEFKPVVQLEEVETKSGEEDEDILVDLKCKLYRFDHENSEWKERGIGQAKLLQHKENKKIRMLMRQEKTLKIRANHIVMPGTKLQEHSGNDKAWVWSAVDFADESQKVELFCIRFGSVEKAQEFKKAYEGAADANAKLIDMSATPAAKDEGDKTAEALASEVEAKATVDA